jgi:protein tyrosine phosphatase (PTP) superfamily phosphohydrolase (DUF442 family)
MLRYLLLLCVAAQFLFAAEPASPAGPAQVLESTHLHNVFRIDGELFSGNSPDTEEAFQELAKLGVKVLISVDGAKPPVELARKYGMRYVHLPFSYAGVPQNRGLELAKAVKEAGGPVYVHCHHGKHRGPAAVASACVSVKGWSPERAGQFLKQAGTSPDYAGLYRDVAATRPPTSEQMAALRKLPEVAETPLLVETMVAIDEHFDALKAAQKSGWEARPGKRVAAESATLLWEQYRELLRDPSTDKHGAGYRKEMEKAEDAAAKLRAVLGDASATISVRDAAMKVSAQSCASCHKAHRN